MSKREKQPKKVKTPKTAKRSDKVRKTRMYRKKQSSTSVYFLLWAIFSVMSLFIVVLSGVTQQTVMVRSYKEQAAQEINEKGIKIEKQVLGVPPSWTGGNYSGFLQFLAKEYDVNIVVLNNQGEVLFPREPNFDPSAPEIEQYLDYSDEIKVLLKKLEKTDKKFVVYEGDGEYVYGSKISLYENSEMYLYIGKSLQLVQTASERMAARTVLICIFMFVLSFAVSSAIAGWFTKPITEMTEKARQLAQGDFDVDFHGVDYGKEMVELAETLNFARDELSKTDKMQKELIANVSHDFKTPLTMIKAYASMIMEISGDIPEKRNKHAQVIVDEADRLASLVGDVLDISKLRSGIEELKQNVFDMSAYTYEILGRFDYLKDTQGYKFVTDIEEDLYTCADELKIGQVLYNLIGNAVNYTGEDKTVYVHLKKENENVFRFSVQDTGAGIKPEELSEIWDRYYRSSEMHKRPVKGTGLGLSIVKTVLQRHGLLFGVESEVGKGSTFYVLFPLVAEKQTDSEV